MQQTDGAASLIMKKNWISTPSVQSFEEVIALTSSDLVCIDESDKNVEEHGGWSDFRVLAKVLHR